MGVGGGGGHHLCGKGASGSDPVPLCRFRKKYIKTGQQRKSPSQTVQSNNTVLSENRKLSVNPESVI